MDWKRLDGARRSAGPLEVDLIESFAQGKINRRNFVKRGTVIGLSIPFMGSIIAACGGSSSGGGGSDGGGGSSTPAGSTPAAGSSAGGGGGGAAGGVITIANQKPSGPLDPIAMQDLGSYNILAQSFEFLVGLNDEGDIGPSMLATEWTPNDDGSVWTFKLREGVKWQDGSDFTSADVAATMDRLVASNNAAIAGVFEEGAVDSTDPLTAVFTLTASNGNLPYLVSVFNAQSVITPAAYEVGSTLDAMPNGTGPWKLDSYDPSTGAIFSRSDSYWGDAPLLDGVNIQVFADIGGTGVTAMQSGSVDAIQQFSVVGGEGLLSSGDFTVLAPPSAAHREIWMRCSDGQFADKRVRQALALTFNRQAMVDQLFTGRATIGNDHVFADFLPFFDASSVPQRERDIAMAKQLLSDAGVEGGISAQLNCGDLQEIPDLANIIVADAAEAGFTLTVNVESQDTFYGNQWCPAEPADPPCSGAAELGIVDYGHRPVPDTFLNAALKTGGVWNSSQYMNPEYDSAFEDYQRAVTVDDQTAAATKLATILNEDVPIGMPYFYDYLSGHSTSVSDMQVTALGHTFVQKASKS